MTERKLGTTVMCSKTKKQGHVIAFLDSNILKKEEKKPWAIYGDYFLIVDAKGNNHVVKRTHAEYL